MTERRR